MLFEIPPAGRMFELKCSREELDAMLVHAGKLNVIKYARMELGVSRREPDPDFEAEYQFCYQAIMDIFA